MSIIQVAPSTPNCYGVMCPKHAQCARYLAVDGATGGPHTIGTCHDNGGAVKRPLFVLKVSA